MNRKFLLLFSILIIAIGVTGILVGYGDDKKETTRLAQQNNEKKVTILLAQAIRDLPSDTLLDKTDYAIKKIAVDESSDLIKSDISDIININSYLLKTNVVTGSYITKDMLVPPDSDEFIHLNLQKDYMIYKFDIKQQEDYLLNTLRIGDTISLQLRTLETDKKKGMGNGIVINTKKMSGISNKNYSLNDIISSMKVVRIKKHSVAELSEQNRNNQKNNEEIKGYIYVVMKTKDLDLIRLVENSGDIFLMPSYNIGDNTKHNNLYEIIPKLRTTRELRG